MGCYGIGVSRLVLQKLSEFITYHPKEEYVLYNGVDTTSFIQKKQMKIMFLQV